MMLKRSANVFVPILVFYIVLNSFIIVGRNLLARWHADQDVLIIGNLLLFLITLLSFVIAKRGLQSANPHAFLRSVYGGILVKLFLCIIVAVIYIAIYKSAVNKPALFTCMGLYLIYSFLEVTALTRLLKQKTHG